MIKYRKNGTYTGAPFIFCAPNWLTSDSIDTVYTDEYMPYYLGHISEVDGSYSAWSFNNIASLDSDTLVILFGNRPAHFATTGNKTYACKYSKSTGQCVVSLTPINGVAQSLIKDGDAWYAFTKSKRYTTTDFVTWTEDDVSADYGQMYGVNFNGRYIALPNTSTKNLILVSDNKGISWTTINTLFDKYITHGGIAVVGDTCVIYCTSTSPTNTKYVANPQSGDRYVITSKDGLNWTEPVKCSGDLEYGGPSYVSGAFTNIGDAWYYFTSNRTQIPPSNGKMNLFKGTATDVINGTMQLLMCVDDITVDEHYDNASSSYMTDCGNVGIYTDGVDLYCTYNRPLGHSPVYWCSNSMQVLSVVSKRKRQVATDDYYDSEWKAKRDAFIASQNTDHTWYAYVGKSNMTQAEIKSGVVPTDYGESTTTNIVDSFEFDADVEIPFINGFRLEVAFNRLTSPSGSSQIGANINGESFSAYIDASWGRFVPAVLGTSGAGLAELYGRGLATPNYMVLEYKNGILSGSCNGLTYETIKNVSDVSDITWPTQNVVYISSVWSYLNSRSSINNHEIRALAIDIW